MRDQILTAVTILMLALMLAMPVAVSAQLGPQPSDTLTQTVTRAVGDVESLAGMNAKKGGNGHDKCKGNGHGNDKSGGHEGEGCGEEETPPETAGPVSDAVCSASLDAVESSWRRYSCTVSIYNEAYATDVATDTQAYVVDIGDHTVAVGQETGGALLSALTNGANGLVLGGPRPPTPPQPVIPTDVTAIPAVVQQFAVATQNYVQNYTIDAGNHAAQVGQTGAGAILSALTNGANGLVLGGPRPPTPPQPVMPGVNTTVQEGAAIVVSITSGGGGN